MSLLPSKTCFQNWEEEEQSLHALEALTRKKKITEVLKKATNTTQ